MKFSLVIATLNGAETLGPALESVFAQSYPDWEVIVQDGGSTDGTQDILKGCGPRVDWRSEPDTGVYDAWNKAVARITGDWVLFLGADDRLLHENVLIQCRRHLARLPAHIDFAYGALLLGTPEDTGRHLCCNRSLRAMYTQFLSDMGLPFPATFVRASVFREHAFDPGYAIAGDYAFTAGLVTRSNVARLPVLVTFMQRGGISDSPANAEKLLEERARVLRTRVAPRAGEFVNAIADRLGDRDTFLEDIPRQVM